MPVTREELYEEVWKEPMLAVGERYGVSSSFMARVCHRMRVPCPPRGYWAKNRAGVKVKRPPLPTAQPGDEICWDRGGQVVKLPPALPEESRTGRAKRKLPSLQSTSWHPHMAGIDEYFRSAQETRYGYLRPSKLRMPDLFVSKKLLPSALALMDEFYRYLHRSGYEVDFGSTTCRPFLNYCEGKTEKESYDGNWHPSKPTVARMGGMEMGVTVFEISEKVDARYLNGKYVRLSEAPEPKKSFRDSGATWIAKHEFLTGRLAIRAFSPYYRVSWEKTWKEAEAGTLSNQFKTIVEALEQQAKTLIPKIRQAFEEQRKEEERRVIAMKEWQRKREIEAEERRVAALAQARAKAASDSKEELFHLIHKWSEAKRVREFLLELEDAISRVPDERREALMDRIRMARKFLGTMDVLEALEGWKTPAERFSGGNDQP